MTPGEGDAFSVFSRPTYSLQHRAFCLYVELERSLLTPVLILPLSSLEGNTLTPMPSVACTVPETTEGSTWSAL